MRLCYFLFAKNRLHHMALKGYWDLYLSSFWTTMFCCLKERSQLFSYQFLKCFWCWRFLTTFIMASQFWCLLNTDDVVYLKNIFPPKHFISFQVVLNLQRAWFTLTSREPKSVFNKSLALCVVSSSECLMKYFVFILLMSFVFLTSHLLLKFVM